MTRRISHPVMSVGRFKKLISTLAALSVWCLFVGTALGADTNVGDIAVMETDATILQPGELFDLNNKSITFTPKPGAGLPGGNGYFVRVGALDFEGTLGTNQSMIDDDFRSQAFGFNFPFYGVNRSSVFINSNGHLTFIASRPDDFHYNDICFGDVDNIFHPAVCPDAFTVLDLHAEDVPRIAVLWQDWDPSTGGGVFVRSLADRLVVTWNAVPLFQTATVATFQVVLFNNGLIRMNYQSVTTTPGGGYLVGLSPGALNPFLVTTTDFSVGGSSISQFPSFEPLAQVFGNPNATIPLVHSAAVARRFFKRHGDQVDQLVMFTNFTEAMFGGFAFELTARQTVSGIGDGPPFVNVHSFFGSPGRLHSFVNMNRLSLYPANPNTNVLGTNNTLDILGQETGHAWLAFVDFNDGGVCSNQLLGRALAHWSFFHDTDASDMEGNRWQDNLNGTFTSVEATSRFSALDQHLMGLRAGGEVPNFFFIRNPTSAFCAVQDPATGERSCAPQTGVNVSGARANVSLSLIQNCEGARSPANGFNTVNTTTTLRQAFILLIRGGTVAPAGDLSKIENIRAAWVPYFNAATAGRGSINTSLPKTNKTHPDYDGDGKTDIAVYNAGAWSIIRSSDGGNTTAGWGGPDWIPVPADYDGDGKTDIAVYNTGVWSIIRSSDGGTTGVGWGGPGWVPVPGDYDGDGKTDIAVYNAGAWSIIRSSDGGNTVFGWGGPEWTPVPRDYDGDGKTDIAVHNAGAWSIIRSSDGGNTTAGWGGPGWIPVPADYDGDGKADIAVYNTGVWSIVRSSDGGNTVVGWGGPGWVPVHGDYDADGKTDVGVYNNGAWSIVRSLDGGNTVFGWGGPTWVPARIPN